MLRMLHTGTIIALYIGGAFELVVGSRYGSPAFETGLACWAMASLLALLLSIDVSLQVLVDRFKAQPPPAPPEPKAAAPVVIPPETNWPTPR